MQIKEIPLDKKDKKIFTSEFMKIVFADLSIKMTFSMINVLIPIYIIDQGYSTSIAGLATTFYMLTAAAFRPVSGNLVDKQGRFRVLMIGSIVYCLATALYLFPIPIWVLLGVQVLLGFGFAFNGTALRTMATDIIPENRMSEGLGYLGLTQTFSIAISPLIILAIKNAFGYRAAFIVVFSFAIIIIFSRIWLKPLNNPIRVKDKSVSKPIKEAENESVESKQKSFFLWKLVDRNACKPSLIMLFMMFANSAFMTFLVPYASAQGINNAGIYFTAYAIMTAAVRLVVGKIHEKFGSVGVLAPGILLFFLSLVAIFIKVSVPVLAIAGALSGLSMGAILPQVNSLAVLTADKESRGMANSTLFLEMDIGNALGSVILGTIANAAGLRLIFGITASIALLTLGAYLLLRKKDFFGEKKVAQ